MRFVEKMAYTPGTKLIIKASNNQKPVSVGGWSTNSSGGVIQRLKNISVQLQNGLCKSARWPRFHRCVNFESDNTSVVSLSALLFQYFSIDLQEYRILDVEVSKPATLPLCPIQVSSSQVHSSSVLQIGTSTSKYIFSPSTGPFNFQTSLTAMAGAEVSIYYLIRYYPRFLAPIFIYIPSTTWATTRPGQKFAPERAGTLQTIKENCQEIELYIVFSILFLLSTKKKKKKKKKVKKARVIIYIYLSSFTLMGQTDAGSEGKLANLSTVKGDKVPLRHLKGELEGR
jgi:hypothetical protein